MALNLVLDIGNTRLKGALFEGDSLIRHFALPSRPEVLVSEFQSHVLGKGITSVLLSSVNEPAAQSIKKILQELGIPFYHVLAKDLCVVLDVEEPMAVGEDRIANIYGALFHFPKNDCLVIDIGTAVTFDFVTKEGVYKGGAIYPGPEICAKALCDYTDKLPLTPFAKPPSPVGKTTKTHIQSGIYYGLLGALERLIFELKMESPSPSSVQVVATGGATQCEEGPLESLHMQFLDDLKELVDSIDPYLTLIGLHEILKEHLIKKEK